MIGSKSFIFRFADVEVREREFSLIKAGEVLPVEPKAFRVLLILLRNPQKLITKEELLEAVWGDAAVTENSLTRSVALLRRLSGDETRNPRFIETVATVGYRFVCSVEVSEDTIASIQAPNEPRPNGQSRGDPVVSRAIGASADLPVQIEKGSGNEPKTGPEKKKGLPKWALPSAAALFSCLAVTVWYLYRAVPPPHVTEYVRITNDGHVGGLAGTDGSRIYLNSNSEVSVEQVAVSGGEIARVSIGSLRGFVRDVSSDGGYLLVRSSDPQGLWAVGAVGGLPRFIADPTGTYNHTWSPDAKLIAYNDPRGNLYSMRSDGTDVRRLVTVKGIITDVAWSRDGSRIRFTLDDALWEITSAGRDLHPVLLAWQGPVGQCCGRWTPNGDLYVFLAGGNDRVGAGVGGFQQIWALDERHSVFHQAPRKPVPLTSGPLHWGTPIPSKDGQKIFAPGATPRGELVRYDAKSHQLQSFLGGISAEFLSFSRDGSQVAYVTYPDGVLWRAKADGSERVQLTSPPVYPLVCRWSPDGSQILFSAQRDSSHYGLYTISAQGGSPAPIALAETGDEAVDGNWSPDGRRIVYAQLSHPSLWILDVASHKASKIPGSDGLYSPRWSPDGRYIAALPVVSIAVNLFDIQTQQWSILAQHIGSWGFPTWSRDSKFLYALHQSGPWSVDRLPVASGAPERIVDLTAVPLAGAAHFWFGLDPNDTPLLLRDNGNRDIYALTLEEK